MVSTAKQSKAFRMAGIPEMPATRNHIWRNVTDSVPDEVLSGMTAKQIAALIATSRTSKRIG